MTSLRRTLLRSSVATALALLVTAPGASAATGTGPDFAPDLVVSSFRASLEGRQFGDRYTIDMAFEGAAGWYRQFQRFAGRTAIDAQIERPALQQFGTGTRRKLAYSSVVKRPFPAVPDGYSSMDYQLLDGVPSALARHRAGTSMLEPTVLNGQAVLKGTTPIAANECAGTKAGIITFWLDAVTLLPVRTRTTAGKQTQTFDATYSATNTDIPDAAFARNPARTTTGFDQRFHRVSPATADARIAYVPRMPTFVPAGFVLGLTGWAPKSNVTGPEASLPAGTDYFSATWRRGVERIDITQRLGGKVLRRYWLDDPFAGECMDLKVENTTVNGSPARYGIGPRSAPHLFWKEGKLLLTVSGPYPKETLVAIAESLTPIA